MSAVYQAMNHCMQTSPDDYYVSMFSNNTEMDAHAFCTPPNAETLHGGCLVTWRMHRATVKIIGGGMLAQKWHLPMAIQQCYMYSNCVCSTYTLHGEQETSNVK